MQSTNIDCLSVELFPDGAPEIPEAWGPHVPLPQLCPSTAQPQDQRHTQCSGAVPVTVSPDVCPRNGVP